MASSSLVAKLTRKQLEKYVPVPQPYFSFINSKWKVFDGTTVGPTSPSAPRSPISGLRLITWNIDFMAPCCQARMAAALSHLQKLVEGTPRSTAIVIALQELMQDSVLTQDDYPVLRNDLGQITSSAWVQERFNVTDLASDHWRCQYNGSTLVDKRMAIKKVARLPFVSEYEREALLVDITVSPHGQGEQPAGGTTPVLRICNVHLDSMAGRPPLRPIQWKACAKYLQDESGGIVAGIVAGDCNANQAYDLVAPPENGFQDLYLELGGEEESPEGFTWGLQSRKSRFPPKRMDKVCYWQPKTSSEQWLLRPKSITRIGIGIRVEEEAARKQLEEAGYLDFVTDHYGLMADFEIGENWGIGQV